MTVSISGNTDHVHVPCPRCGYGRRYKQWPNAVCAAIRHLFVGARKTGGNLLKAQRN